MDICLVRHAQPDWMAGGTGTMDPGLTELGVEQAARLAERARTWDPIDEIWVSPATRSQQTAAPLIEVLGAPARTLPWLLEIRPPDFDGLPPDEMQQMFRGVRYRPVPDWWAGLPGGEAASDFVARIAAGFVDELGRLGVRRVDEEPHWRELPRGRRIVIVSHAGTSGAALAHLVGLPQVPWAWERFRLGHAATSVVRTSAISEGLIFALHSFNDREHLPRALRTV
jgi:probable phosphoglycerate mutase